MKFRQIWSHCPWVCGQCDQICRNFTTFTKKNLAFTFKKLHCLLQNQNCHIWREDLAFLPYPMSMKFLMMTSMTLSASDFVEKYPNEIRIDPVGFPFWDQCYKTFLSTTRTTSYNKVLASLHIDKLPSWQSLRVEFLPYSEKMHFDCLILITWLPTANHVALFLSGTITLPWILVSDWLVYWG